MSSFLLFWWESLLESIESSWGIIGGVDLAIAAIGAIVYDYIKDRGPTGLRNLLSHPALSDRWRLCAIFLGCFLVSTLFLAPYWQYQKSETTRLALVNKSAEIEKQLTSAQGQIAKLTNSNEVRQNQINSLEAYNKGAISDPDAWPPLTDAQIAQWIVALKSFGPKRVSVQWFASDTDARGFYKSLKKVGKDLDWNMAGYEPMDGIVPGLTIASRPDDPAALSLRKLLKEYSGKEPKWVPDNYDAGVINIKIGDKMAQSSSSPDNPQAKPPSAIIMLPGLSSPPTDNPQTKP